MNTNSLFTISMLLSAFPFLFLFHLLSTAVDRRARDRFVMADGVFAATMLSAMADVSPTSSTAPSTDVEDDQDEDNDFHPFDARELRHVADRVELPITVEVDGDRFVVTGVEMSHAWDTVTLDTADGPVTVTDGSAQVELVGRVTVLDAPRDVVAYGTRDGELLCADHGAPFDIGVSDGAVYPVLRGSNDLEPVEYCDHYWSHGEHGHSFCGTCGTDLQAMPGAHDRDIEGPFARCWNCDTTSVYVDGHGYVFCDGFGSLLDSVKCEVRGFAAYCQTDLNGYTGVHAVDADNVPRLMRSLQAYAVWLEVSPADGVLLVLCEDEDECFDVADAWAESTVDLEDFPEDEREGVLSDTRADTRVVRLKLEDIAFTTR